MTTSRPDGRIPGAGLDLARLINTHLFVVCANNSGSTFLAAALGTSAGAWRLPLEGHRIRGYVGPVPWRMRQPDAPPPDLLWAARPEWIEQFADPARHDWPRTRKVWYFHASASNAQASVFVAKSPPQLLQVEQLAAAFSNARFLFVVRNPYAVCEGICRRYRTRLVRLYEQGFVRPGRNLERMAAEHVAACMARQRRNIEATGEHGAFFTYEAMCASPQHAVRRISRLVPELAGVELRQRLLVKDYHEQLTNMNPRQLANLTSEQIATFNQVFRPRRELLYHFGYDLLEPA